MTQHRTARRLAGPAVAGVLAVSGLGLTACGSDTAATEAGADVQDVTQEEAAGPYDGVYDVDFHDDVDSWVGEEVTLSADVSEVLSPSSFTIAGTDDTTVEPLLVVSATEVSGLADDLAVSVTGTVEESFALTDVEDELGVDLEDGLYTDWEGEHYVVATSVDTSVPADQ